MTATASRRAVLSNLTCLVLGLALRIGASLAIATLMPKFGVASIAIVVFVVATIVMSLRVIPIANNILSYFLGLIGYFGSHQEPALSTFVELGAAFALGSFAAWIANTIESRLTRAAWIVHVDPAQDGAQVVNALTSPGQILKGV
jgi:hypothetical protein